MSAGVKRLAVLVGCLGALAHLIFMAVVTNLFTDMDQTLVVWTGATLITGACFLIPFGLVHGIAWVIQGFKQERQLHEGHSANKTVEGTATKGRD